MKGFAQQLLPYGIIVNAIGPGSTATAMQESTVKESIYTSDSLIERMTLPEEIAECFTCDYGSTAWDDIELYN